MKYLDSHFQFELKKFMQPKRIFLRLNVIEQDSGIAPSTLSQWLDGKRNLTNPNCGRLLHWLEEFGFAFRNVPKYIRE